MQNLASYWIYILLITLIAFLPGFAIASSMKKLNISEKLAVSFGFSFLVLVLFSPFFAIKLGFQAQILFFIAILIAVLYLKKTSLRITEELKFLFFALTISIISKFALQTLWEYPVGGGDWYYHNLVIPEQFETGNWMPPQDRTPFYNLLIYSYHNLLGTSPYSYWISQIISVVASNIFIIPAFLIAKKAFNERIAKLSVAFMIIALYTIYGTMTTGVRPMATYFILLMIYFLFFGDNNRNHLLAGIFGGLSYLTHNSYLMYIMIAIFIISYNKLFKKEGSFQSFAYFIIPFSLVILPSLLWTYSFYGTPFTSRFVYYPFAVKGYEALLSEGVEKTFEAFSSTHLSQIIWIRVINTAVSLTPITIPINPLPYSYHSYDPVFYFLFSYPGTLSLIMYALIFIWFLKYVTKKTETDTVLVLFVILSFILIILIYGWVFWGFVEFPVYILIMFGISELCRIRNLKVQKFLAYALFMGALFEEMIFGYLLNRFYLRNGGLNNISDAIKNYIPNFEISNFVSAHFFLKAPQDFYGNLALSMLVILLSIYALYKQQPLTEMLLYKTNLVTRREK